MSEKQELTPEQALIASMADTADNLDAEQVNEAEQAQADMQQQAAASQQADLLDTLRMARAMVRPAIWWESDARFMQLWGDHTLQGVAAPLSEIMARNGWELAAVMGKYGPYIALAGALMPPVMVTVNDYKAARAAEAMQQQGQQQETPQPEPEPEAADHG